VLDLTRHTARAELVLHGTASDVTLVQGVADPKQLGGYEPRLYATLDNLLYQLRATHDYILIDAPAGVGEPVRWALDRADLGLLTLVGEPTAVADAYRLVKLVWHTDPAYPIAVVVNFADTEDEAQSVAHRFGTITERFVQQAPNYLGWIPYSAQVRQSVAEQRPAVWSPGPVRGAFAHVADVLVRGRLPVGVVEDAG
jgi:flagellar biosynthesis protein FlhG